MTVSAEVIIVLMAGMALPSITFVDSIAPAKFVVIDSKSPVPRDTRKLFQAAVIMAVEPWIVVEASSEDTPVIPMFSWTTWMASTMSAKLSMEYSTVSPFAALSFWASSSSRFISDCVPP